MRRTLVALAASLALTGAMTVPTAAPARSLSQAEATSLDTAVKGYLQAIARGDSQRVAAALPPRIISLFAAQSGTDAATLRQMLADQTASVLKGSKFSALESAPASDAGDATLDDGATVVWAVVPTRFVVETGGAKSRTEQPMLAILEGGNWFFIRIEGAAQTQMVSLAYPFLADAHFPPAKTTPVN